MKELAPHAIDEVTRIFKRSPFISDLGAQLVSIGEGECEASLPLAPRHLQQDGFVHAGVQATMADHTAGTAAATLIGPRERVLTAEFKINLLRAAKGDRLRCCAKVLKGGSRLTVVEAEVFCRANGEEKLVSKATVTLAVVDKQRDRNAS